MVVAWGCRPSDACTAFRGFCFGWVMTQTHEVVAGKHLDGQPDPVDAKQHAVQRETTINDITDVGATHAARHVQESAAVMVGSSMQASKMRKDSAACFGCIFLESVTRHDDQHNVILSKTNSQQQAPAAQYDTTSASLRQEWVHTQEGYMQARKHSKGTQATPQGRKECRKTMRCYVLLLSGE